MVKSRAIRGPKKNKSFFVQLWAEHFERLESRDARKIWRNQQPSQMPQDCIKVHEENEVSHRPL